MAPLGERSFETDLSPSTSPWLGTHPPGCPFRPPPTTPSGLLSGVAAYVCPLLPWSPRTSSLLLGRGNRGCARAHEARAAFARQRTQRRVSLTISTINRTRATGTTMNAQSGISIPSTNEGLRQPNSSQIRSHLSKPSLWPGHDRSAFR